MYSCFRFDDLFLDADASAVDLSLPLPLLVLGFPFFDAAADDPDAAPVSAEVLL